jgi:ABC-type polysaccharide/polyol phosphate export permease
MKERTSNAAFRNHVSPVPTALLQAATTTIGACLSALQGIILFVVAYLVFDLHTGITWSLIPFMVFIGAVFTIIGQLIGTFSPNEEVGTLLSIITAVIFLIFSSLITPLARITPWLAAPLSYTPFNQAMEVLRRQLLFNESLLANTTPLLILGATFTICAAIVYTTAQKRL